MILKYTNKKKPKPYITIESSHGMESEPNEPIEVKQLSAAQILLKSTMEMREQLHPRERPKNYDAIDFIRRRVKPSVIHSLGPRAAQNLQMIALGERESLLFFDDTYELQVYNLVS